MNRPPVPVALIALRLVGFLVLVLYFWVALQAL